MKMQAKEMKCPCVEPSGHPFSQERDREDYPGITNETRVDGHSFHSSRGLLNGDKGRQGHLAINAAFAIYVN